MTVWELKYVLLVVIRAFVVFLLSLDNNAIPENFSRDDIIVEDRRHLIFGIDAQISVLRRASRWYVDGTFKCMRLPFVMLLTIHVFVKRADCSKQVPLLFALMTGRKARDYVAVFESIKNAIVGQCAVEGMVLDYERGLWKAAKDVFPAIELRGCAFHWGQAIWRTVQRLGLATQYSQDRRTHAFIRKVLSLPFLPKEHIRPTFECMKDYTSSEAVLPFICILELNFSPPGWHRRLNMKTGAAPPFYVLLQVLHLEAKDVEEQIHLVSELSLRRIQRKSTRSMQSRLFSAWDAYTAGDISTSGLLKKVSVIYGHRVLRTEKVEDED
ncbi:hypothetical protein MAR_033602 [Mya arenaria]|uniref:MULE transposase domain-containing protein n=1 Tax=Mya arenaria TaxID=6604 RepID=A0ABY7G9H2_MYAAR|nr:hypothetical protein MAR_033602 [Mya arenaria]